MAIKRLISLPYRDAHRIRERQKAGTMKEYYDREHYLCYSEDDYINYKPKKCGRKPKGTKKWF